MSGVNPDFNKLLKDAMERMDRELKPCPFCGSRKVTLNDLKTVAYVICLDCGCSLNASLSKEHAVRSWNRRVS